LSPSLLLIVAAVIGAVLVYLWSGELAQCTCRPGAGSTRDTTMIKPVTLKGTEFVAAVTAS
jgi:hypothetical protein